MDEHRAPRRGLPDRERGAAVETERADEREAPTTPVAKWASSGELERGLPPPGLRRPGA